MPHYLDPLLQPRSIAIVGATQRKDAVGNIVVENLLAGEYPGKLYAVNPRYDEVLGVACFPDLASLPAKVEHVIFAVGDEYVEAAFDDALAHGIASATIFSSLLLENDKTPVLRERIRTKAIRAGVLLCGGNGMGYYNFTYGIRACGFDTRAHQQRGNVTLISQSGSGMSGILDVDERIDFNFAVSSGQELNVSLEDYLDYALEQSETRVVGLFMETSRHPAKLVAALAKARERRIPVVAVKVGRTALAAELAVSHSGAMAGSDSVYDALFAHYGVQRVDDMDQLATALIMFAQPHAAQAGGVVSIHDSGGERQLLIDLADKLDVPLAKLSDETCTILEDLLDPGLPAVNPLDAWSVGGADYHLGMAECFSRLLCDEDAALGAVVHDRAPEGQIYPSYIDYLRKGHAASGKPVFLVASRQGIGSDPQVLATTREGFPVIDGVSAFLSGARCMLKYRDFLEHPAARPPALATGAVAKWQAALTTRPVFDEHMAGLFLQELGVPMLASHVAGNDQDLLAHANRLGYPLVMKTAMPGVAHKSDADGVRLNISNETALLAAYADFSERLGEKVLVAPMLNAPGVEMILGISRDAQFGPVIVMGIGGVFTEVLHDVVCMLPPFDAAMARRSLDRLKLRKLLDGVRGMPAVDVAAYCKVAALLSVLALEFEDTIKEVDINPLRVLQSGCLGLDALLVLNDAAPVGGKVDQAMNM